MHKLIFAALMVCATSSAALAESAPTVVSLGCANTSDGQWNETVQGLHTLFGHALTITADRGAGTVSLAGPDDARAGAVRMATDIARITCSRAQVAYRLVRLPPGTALEPALARAAAAGAMLSPGHSALSMPTAAVREMFVTDVLALPGAVTLLDITTPLMHRRGQSYNGTVGDAGAQIAMEPVVTDRGTAIVRTMVSATWPSKVGASGSREKFSAGNDHHLAPGQADVSILSDSERGALVEIFAVTDVTR